jgi:hypothetical protein
MLRSKVSTVGTALVTLVLLSGLLGLALGRSPSPQTAAQPLVGQDPPAASVVPQASVAALPANCDSAGLATYVTSDGPARTVSTESSAAEDVVVATVTAVQKPVWNTADGTHQPLAGTWPRGSRIYTPVTIAVGATLKGASAAALTILVPGGAIGCDSQIVEDVTAPAVGSRVAVFLVSALGADGKPDVNHLAAFQAWPVDSQGNVSTPENGKLSASSFATATRASAP